MTPGPDLVLKTVPGTLVKIASISSGNTFRAVYWTDGKREAPMMPDEPWLRCQPDTGELFWTDECEKVARVDCDDQTYDHVPHAEEPSWVDYQEALKTGLGGSKEKEHYIRLRYWWVGNDPIRRGEVTIPKIPDFNGNLLKLRALLDPGILDQRLMAIEISRELRDFQAAELLLDYLFPEEYKGTVDLLRKLIAEKDHLVRKFHG